MKKNKLYLSPTALNLKSILLALVILLSVYLSYYPVFHGDAWWGHDWLAHLNRIHATLNNLQQGQFPPYFDTDYRDFPGYSWNLFYPPLFNLIAAPIQYFTQDYNVTTKSVTLIIALIATRCAYVLFYLLNPSASRALIVALCYSCSLYAVDNLFIRFAFPESLALAFFPLLLAGVLTDDPKRALTRLIIANTFILLANIPAALSVILFFVVYFSFHYQQTDKIKVFIQSYCFSVLLSAWFIFPLVYTAIGANFYLADTNFFMLISAYSIDLFDFISGRIIRHETLNNMVLGLGYPVFFTFVFCLWKSQNVKQKQTLILLVLVFFITTPVNYDFLPDALSIFSKIQFAWRLIPFALLLVLLEICQSRYIRTSVLVLVLTLTALMSTVMTITIYQAQPTKKDLNAVTEQFTQVHYLDYVLTEASQQKEKVSPTHLSCQAKGKHLSVSYTKSRNPNGLPAYTFALPDSAVCTIPFLAYRPLQLKNIENDQHDGFFQTSLNKGQHTVSIGVKPIFQGLLYCSLFIALITLCYLNQAHILRVFRKLTPPAFRRK